MAEIDHSKGTNGKHLLKIPTRKPFEIFKQDTSRELDTTWMSFAIRYSWNHDVCSIETFGATGTIKLEGGFLVVEAQISPWLPDWFEEKILNDIKRAMRSVSQYSRVQEEEEESRRKLREAALRTYHQAYCNELEASKIIDRWQIIDDVNKLVVVFTGSGSAVSVLAKWAPFATVLAVVTALVSIAHAGLRVADRVKDWGETKSHFSRVRVDLETFLYQLDIEPFCSIDKASRKFSDLRNRLGEAVNRRRNDLLVTSKLKRVAESQLPFDLRAKIRALDAPDGTTVAQPPRPVSPQAT